MSLSGGAPIPPMEMNRRLEYHLDKLTKGNVEPGAVAQYRSNAHIRAAWFLHIQRPTYAKPQDASHLGVLCHQPKGPFGQPFFLCQVLSLGNNSP